MRCAIARSAATCVAVHDAGADRRRERPAARAPVSAARRTSIAAISLRPFARVWFCYFAAMGAFTLYAPLWFRDLGMSALAIGSIASLQAWTRVFAPYSWGWIADHTDDRRDC